MTNTAPHQSSREILHDILRKAMPLTPYDHGAQTIRDKWGADLDPMSAQLVTLDYDYHGHPPIDGVHQGRIRFQHSLVQALLSDYQAVADDRFGETAFGLYTPPRVGPAIKIVEHVDEFAYQGSGNHTAYEGIYRCVDPQTYGPETQIDITPASFKKWVWQLDYQDIYNDYLDKTLPSDETITAHAPYALRTSVKTAFVMTAFLQKRESSLSLDGLKLALSAAGLGEGQIEFGFINNAQLEQRTCPMAHVQASRLMIYRYTARDIWVFRHRTSGRVLMYIPGNSSPLHEFSDLKAMRTWVVQQGKDSACKKALASHFAKDDRLDGTYHAGVFTALEAMVEYPKMHRLGREAGFFNNDGYWNPDDYISLDTVPNALDPFVELVKVLKEDNLNTAQEAIRDDADVNRANLSAAVETAVSWINRWGALAIFFPGGEGFLALAGLIEAGYGLNEIASADTHAEQAKGLTRVVFGLLNALPLIVKAGTALARDVDAAAQAVKVPESETPGAPEPVPESLPALPVKPPSGIPLQPPGTEGLELTQWTRPQLMRGFGDAVEGLSDETLEQIRQVSDVSDDHLRYLHAEGLAPQGILADTIVRFKLDSEVELALHQKGGAVALSERIALFDRRYLEVVKPDSELLQSLSHEFPSLPKAVLEEMLARENLSPHSELTLGQMKQLFQRFEPHVHGYEQSLRMARAYEGLFLGSVRSTDSDTLLLHSFRRMPGWPKDVSIVVRDGSPTGAVLDRVGATSLPKQRLVVKIGNQFQGYNELRQPTHASDDFADMLVHTMTEDELRAMNLHLDRGLEHFRFKVRRSLLNRADFTSVLQRQSLRSAFFEPEDIGLRGGAGGQQAQVPTTTTRAQVKRYFPEATDQHADDFIARFGDTHAAEIELQRLQSGYPQLEREVGAWEKSYKGPDVAERNRRLAIGATLRRLYKWQGEPAERVYRDGRLLGFKLNINLGTRTNQTAPLFSTRLNSVVSLRLTGRINRQMEALFTNFSHIERLEMSLSGLSRPPAALELLTELRALDMSRTSLILNSVDTAVLAKLPRLQELNLAHCRLKEAPPLYGLKNLRVLNLSYNNISMVSYSFGGVSEMTHLEVLDLSWNRRMLYAPDIGSMPALRVLDLTETGLTQPPSAFGTAHAPLQLEILRLSGNNLRVAPSLRGMTALHEVDLTNTGIDRFPEGITSEIPSTRLILRDNHIASIPESIELRKGFDLRGNSINDPVSLRRLIAARRQTGTDIWLGAPNNDRTINLWLRNVPQAQIPNKSALWLSFANDSANQVLMEQIRALSRTPEFLVERQLLQRRVWTFLENFNEASAGAREEMRAIADAGNASPQSLAGMFERLETIIREHDAGRQNLPMYPLPKRPRLH
ncbi:leucine-rich repeat domain-containing protein [Pseudomonas sp. BTN1]|uniref:leucine-rich repeat domain-containing protein n=1 Tax=Pseudomonas sp. BTN1 TaxID=1750647 RepID=UPI00093F3C84|nr:DUF6543 domain-containing protein [Pseudomonas sp. BTN1]OKO47442.1 hypothetical protein BMH52_15455 [Pseudomonas sp. BTN1]